ncbi:MAG TPA: hypothetical protein PKL15_15310 [Saprospiraceae bacterium]|nr:hypothetical protein [Saprospiraceae bacterium]
MDILLTVPCIIGLAYSCMIISAWQAYVRGNHGLVVLARVCALISLLATAWYVVTGQFWLIPFHLGAIWACWQLSARIKN